MLRKKMLDACIKKQQLLIDDFKGRVKALLDTEDLGNEEEYDNTQLSQKGQASEEVNNINEALSLANEEMNFLLQLKSADNNSHSVVGPGAIIITDKAVFFISVSIEQFGVDGETFIGISTKSPLYLTMKGLPKESIFCHNGTNYKILDIF
jgi:hypothetical protein